MNVADLFIGLIWFGVVVAMLCLLSIGGGFA